MKASKVGYLVGYICGYTLIYGIYALALFGMFDQLRNGQIPYVPLVLFIIMLTWRKAVQIYTVLIALSIAITSGYPRKDTSNEQLDRLMQQVMRHGGSN